MSYSFVTPWTVTSQAPLFMGFPRQAYWSGLPFPTPGDPPDPGIKPSPLALDSLLLRHQGFGRAKSISWTNEPFAAVKCNVPSEIYIGIHHYSTSLNTAVLSTCFLFVCLIFSVDLTIHLEYLVHLSVQFSCSVVSDSL